MTATDIWLLYSTFPSREKALSAMHRLVEKRLVACANIYENVTSVYCWEGKVQQEAETVVMAKTRREKLPEAMEALKIMHSYELPCILAWPLSDGFPPFLQWVKEETGC